MLDIRLIRENPAFVRQALEKRGESADIIGALDSILEIDERYRNLLRRTEELRAKHNEISKQLGKSKEKPPQLITQMRQLGEQISSLQQQTKEAKGALDSLLLELPNMPHPSVPVGRKNSSSRVKRCTVLNPRGRVRVGREMGVVYPRWHSRSPSEASWGSRS